MQLNSCFLSFYWYNRTLTLRDYSSFVQKILEILNHAHPLFKNLEWVGDGKRKPVSVKQDMTIINDLVYRHSWDKRYLIGGQNAAKPLTWEVESLIGYQMTFNTGRSPIEGGYSVSVHAGDPGNITPNNVIIGFPAPAEKDFFCIGFHDYNLLLNLFLGIAGVTNPERGLVTSIEFSRRIYDEGPYDIGWLTYFSNDRCALLADQFPTVKTDLPGTLFSFGEKSILDDSEETVFMGRRLREALVQAGVIH